MIFFVKILIQSVRIHRLLEGAKYCRKLQPCG